MANEAQARGSEKLLAQLAKKGAAATFDEVKAAVSLPATSDYTLLRWLYYKAEFPRSRRE